VKGSSRTTFVKIAFAVGLACHLRAGLIFADGPVLKLRATVIGADTSVGALTIELFRWSTDAERAPLLAALSAPPPPVSAGPPSSAAGRGGGRGRGAAPPPSPQARLTTAIKAAPTLGYIWGAGVTGYSIKYAWRSSPADGTERIVLAIDRRLGAHAPGQYPRSAPAPDTDFTLIEIQFKGPGRGQAKTSLSSAVVVDTAAQTLAVESYAAASPLLEVTR
jgi:hypothetical protein